MDVLLFGASGMVGGGVLTECLEDPSVRSVVSVGRSPSGRTHPKLRDVLVADLFDLDSQRGELGTPDACFYCLGVSSAGMGEEAYRRITVELTEAVADVLEALDPSMTLCFVSGLGSGSGRAMWARVKGEAEQAVLARPFDSYVFRPGFIQPVKGARSSTRLYRILYRVAGPLLPLVRRVSPDAVTTTEVVGRAMLRVAREGAPTRTLEMVDIHAAGGADDPPGGRPGV